MVEIAIKLSLEVESEDVKQLLQSHKTRIDGELLLMDEQRKRVFDIGTIPGENVVITLNVSKQLEYYINIADKPAAGFERLDSNFEKFCQSNAIKRDCMLQRSCS